MIPAQELRKRQEAIRLFEQRKRTKKIRKQIDKEMRRARKRKTSFSITIQLQPYEMFPVAIESELREKGYEIKIFESTRWDRGTRVCIEY